MKHYNINYITNTIEVTKKFAKAAGVLNTPEYNVYSFFIANTTVAHYSR